MGSGILFFFSWVEVGLVSVEWFCFISFFLYTFLCAFLCFSFMWVVSSLAFLFMQIIFLKKKWRVIHNLRTEICVFFMCCYSKLCVGRQHGLNDSVGHVPKMSFDRLFFFVHGFKSLVQIFFDSHPLPVLQFMLMLHWSQSRNKIWICFACSHIYGWVTNY